MSLAIGPTDDTAAGQDLLLATRDRPIDPAGRGGDRALWTVGPPAVATGSESTFVRSFAPVRVLDTRPTHPDGRGGVLNLDVLDGNGFIRAGQTLVLSLDPLLVWGWTVFANITLISADQELNAAAIAEGLVVDDPSADP